MKKLTFFLVTIVTALAAMPGFATPLNCQINDDKPGSPTLVYNPEANTVEVNGITTFAQSIDQTREPSTDLRNDRLIHFMYSMQYTASTRFYNALKAGPNEVVIAEYISTQENGSQYDIQDRVYACCFGRFPVKNNYDFVCQ